MKFLENPRIMVLNWFQNHVAIICGYVTIKIFFFNLYFNYSLFPGLSLGVYFLFTFYFLSWHLALLCVCIYFDYGWRSKGVIENYPKKPVSGIYSDNQQVYCHIKNWKLNGCFSPFFPTIFKFMLINLLYFSFCRLQWNHSCIFLGCVINLTCPCQLKWM